MRKSKRALLLALLSALGLWVLSGWGSVQAAPVTQTATPLTVADLQNAQYRTTYTVSRTVTLTDGVFADEAARLQIVLTEDTAFGDLNGDGVDDAAAILAATVAEGEPSLNLVALIAQAGEPAIGGLILLGERVEINTLTIADGKITVDYLRPQPGDSTDSPPRQVTQRFFARRGLLVPEQTKSFGQLFPYEDGTRYGYSNVLGEMVIEPQFALAGEFTEGMAPVSYDGRTTGYINQIGELVIEPRFSYAGNFAQGLALVGVPGVDADAPFLTTYIDRIGRFVFGDQRFVAAQPFSEGLAAVSYDGEQYGYINRQGQLAIALQFSQAGAFREGLAPVQFGGQYGFIDHTGRFVINPQFEAAQPFQDGLAQVVLSGKTGYINGRGEIVIEPTFDYGRDFSEGYALVAQAETLFYIDQAGNVAFDLPNLSKGAAFAEGLAAVAIAEQYGYVDMQGVLVVPPQFTYAGSFHNGLAVVETATSWGLVNSIGEIVLETQRFTTTVAQKQAAPQTTTVDYVPTVPEETRSGFCERHSDLLALASAWQCETSEGDSFDPCLLADDNTTLICAPSPMANYLGFRLELTKPLPEAAQVTAQPPSPIWQVRTDDNELCSVNRLGNLAVDGQIVTHICDDGLALLGAIDRSGAVWTVEKGTLVNNSEGVLTVEDRHRVGIVVAWTAVEPQ